MGHCWATGWIWVENFPEQYWNARGINEEQRFIEVEKGLRGKALRWFQLWKVEENIGILQDAIDIKVQAALQISNQDLDSKLTDQSTIVYDDEEQEEKAHPMATLTHSGNTATSDGEAKGCGDRDEPDASVAMFGVDVDDDAKSSTEVDAFMKE
ncbi:hypothetical protein PIB30_076049 [Stylosanthes scabra]|uniref:Uncharacterized protein n=1 Tax=Stylosanthes scabra TaxID=79078 RepID=A0ABU6XN41_9FABA|nr:hypothetical protein [Stylosanthes scabra]